MPVAWVVGVTRTPGKCFFCGEFIPAKSSVSMRYDFDRDNIKKWQRAHNRCAHDNGVGSPDIVPPPPSVAPVVIPITQAADAMVGIGKQLAKEFVRADREWSEPHETIDEMHCLLHLDHEMRERMVEHERIMVLQVDTMLKVAKEINTCNINLTSSNNRMAGALESLALQFKGWVKKDFSEGD
jgi:hypothetical protein